MSLPVIDLDADNFTVRVEPRIYSTGGAMGVLGASYLYIYPPEWVDGDAITAIVSFGSPSPEFTVPNSKITTAGVYRATVYILAASGVQAATDWFDIFVVKDVV